MEEIINELIDAILKDEKFKAYQQAQEALYDEKTLALLSRQKTMQEDYLRLKNYLDESSLSQMKDELREIKKEVLDNPKIKSYYQTYHELNDLLENVTKTVFQGISEDITLERFQL
ncbi:YlbF family regulator [Longibaculum muris]|uniref:YlbF family regulator n=1 Tax=Longibaculum muris TaxID=1796628 RepID=UPI0012B72DCF|nr:YlbF family regulator [Longibaculum muris]